MRLISLAVLIALVALAACNERALDKPKTDAGTAPGGLTPEQASAVLAKVGDQTITLGDYVMALERINRLDRARYESRERRRELLQELIDAELLAQEARRRGLDKRPEVQESIRQVLRGAQLAKSHQGLPAPADIPMAEIEAYYQKNQEKFREPERRRVAAIVLGDPEKAKEILDKALAIEKPAEWGDLFFEHSLTAPQKRDPAEPPDLAGDLGIVGPPGDPKGGNSRVPAPVQAAVFQLANIGDIHREVIQDGDRFYVIRMVMKTAGHTRTLAEAERGIRVAILQELIRQREQEMEADLRKRFPVTVDEQALRSIELPKALEGYQPLWSEDAGAPEPDEDG